MTPATTCTTWKRTKLGEQCTINVLTIGLFPEFDKAWTVAIYPRRGVLLGRATWDTRLAELSVRAPSVEGARAQAVAAALTWLERNLDRLLAEAEPS
jgi:hypothetical protein